MIKTITEEQYQEAAYELIHAYINAMIVLVASRPDPKELNYLKTLVHFPNGGEYLLSLLHIQGDKINLDSIRESAVPSEPIPEDSL